MSANVAAISERDFTAQLAYDATRLAPRVDATRIAAEQPTPPPRFDAQDLYAGDGPRATDINQDRLGDCYFVATMAAIAEHQPDRIADAIQFDPQSGNYTVTMHEKEWGWMPPGWQTKEVQIPVTQQELADNLQRGGGSTVDNRIGTDKPIWPAVMETAYAKMHDGNWSDGLSQGYQEIDGGHSYDALFALTGTEGETLTPLMFDSKVSAEIMGTQISEALADGRPVTLATDPEPRSLWKVMTGGEATQDGLVDNHVYMVERAYTDSNGDVQVELRNPWGSNQNVGEGRDTWSSTITVKLQDLIETAGLDYMNVGPAR
jgi:hypothetical protein